MESIFSENEYNFENDAHSICRCCLSTGKRVIEIDSFKSLFLDLADIMITDSDGLPQWICYECSAIIQKCVRFKRKVQRAHTMLYDYHNRCAPFPVDGQDPELLKYTSPHLSQSSTLVFDSNKTKLGFNKILTHEKHFITSNLVEVTICGNPNNFDGNLPIKNEVIDDDDVPLMEDTSYELINNSEDFPLNVKEEKKEGKKKIKLEQQELDAKETDVVAASVYNEPKKLLRKPIEIDESKIRIIKLDPTEQLRQREEESKANLKFPFHCHLCYKGFNFEIKLRNHMFKHNPAHGPYKCDICTMYLPTAYSASVHSLTHTRRYECVQCGRRMLDKLAIVNHYRSQHEGVLSVFTCQICGKVSNNVKTHRGHMRNHHSGARVSCDDCGKSFVTRDTLVEHQLIHQGIKNYECEKCGEKFRTRYQMRHHVVKHSDAKDYYCVECDVRFKSALNLRQHLKRTLKHKDKKSFKHECPTCKKRFETESQLQSHVRVQHEGVRKYRCATCGAALASHASLARHVQAVHAAQRAPRTHACNTCGKMFRAKATLITHVRTHTGEKPYECDTCGRSFAQRAALRTHIKLVHLKIHKSAKMKPKMPLSETLPKADVFKEESPIIVRAIQCQGIKNEFFTVAAGP